jgi:hypothetical protein
VTIYLGEFVTIYIFSDAAGEDGGAHGGDGGAHGGDEGNPYLKTIYMYAVTRCSFNSCPDRFCCPDRFFEKRGKQDLYSQLTFARRVVLWFFSGDFS